MAATVIAMVVFSRSRVGRYFLSGDESILCPVTTTVQQLLATSRKKEMTKTTLTLISSFKLDELTSAHLRMYFRYRVKLHAINTKDIGIDCVIGTIYVATIIAQIMIN